MKTIFRLLFVFIFAKYASAGECKVNTHDLTFKKRVLDGATAYCQPTAITQFDNGFSAGDMMNLGIITAGRLIVVGTAAAPYSWLLPIGLSLTNLLTQGSTNNEVNALLFDELFAQLEVCMDANIRNLRRLQIETEWRKLIWRYWDAISDITKGMDERGQGKLSTSFVDMNSEIETDFGPTQLKEQYLYAEVLLPVFKVAAEVYWLTATAHLEILNRKAMNLEYDKDLESTRARLETLKVWSDNAIEIIESMYKPTVFHDFGNNVRLDNWVEWSIKWEEGIKEDSGKCKRDGGKLDITKVIIDEFNSFINDLQKEYSPFIDVLWRNSWLIGDYGKISYHPITQPGEWWGCENLDSNVFDVSLPFIIQQCSTDDECIGFSWSDELQTAYRKKYVNCESHGISTGSPYISVWKSTSPLCYQKVMSGSYLGCRHDAPDVARICTKGFEIDLRALCDSHWDCIGFIWDSSQSYGCLRTAEGCASYGIRQPTVYDFYAKCRSNSDYAINKISSHEIIVVQLRINGQCLDRYTANTELNYLFFTECNDAVTQKWKYDLETREIISMFDNHCLHVTSQKLISTYYICGGWGNQQWLFYSKALRSVYNKKCIKFSENGFVTSECADWNDVLRWELIPIIDKTERFTETVTTQCYDEIGGNSGSTDDALSSVTCNAGYQLVSCGTYGSNSGNIDGSFISGDTCYAQMGGGAMYEEYVQAVARCCRLHGTPSCSSYSSSNGAAVDVFCSNNEMLTGCTVSTHWKYIDGAFPRDDIITSDTDITDSFTHFLLPRCAAQGGFPGAGVFANARCCGYSDNRYNLKCGTIKSTYKSGYSYTATVSCPTGWFLSGCSAYSSTTTATSWYIANDECIAKATNGENPEEKGVWAVAICCQEAYDPSYEPHCYSAIGDPSGSVEDLSSATCGFGYKLVSCGTSGSTTGNIEGSFMDSTTCYARVDGVASSGEYVRAVARCCAFSSTCTSYKSIESGSKDDDTTDVYCPHSLTGCTVEVAGLNYVDGAYPRDTGNTNLLGLSGTFYQFINYQYNQVCRAQNGGGSSIYGVFAYARCCTPNDNRYKMQCGAIKSEMSGADNRASVSCPSGWALTGCSGLSHWKAATMWYTEDEQCIAIAKDGSLPNYGVWAVGICCKESFDYTKYAAKQIENEKRLIDDGIHDSGYRDNKVTVIVSSLIGVFGVFFIFAVMYCCVHQSLMNMIQNMKHKL